MYVGWGVFITSSSSSSSLLFLDIEYIAYIYDIWYMKLITSIGEALEIPMSETQY